MNAVSQLDLDPPVPPRRGDTLRPDGMAQAARELERAALGWAVELTGPIDPDGSVTPTDQWLLTQLVTSGRSFQTVWCPMAHSSTLVRLMWTERDVHLELKHDRGLTPDVVENAVVTFCALHTPEQTPAEPALVAMLDPAHPASRSTIERVTNLTYQRLAQTGSSIPAVARSATMPVAALPHALATIGRLGEEVTREYERHRQYVTRQTFKLVAHLWDQPGCL